MNEALPKKLVANDAALARIAELESPITVGITYTKPAEIEPTEEQCDAAEAFIVARLLSDDDDIPPLARLLAEREHKLRDELTKKCDPTVDMCGGCSACVHWHRERSIRRDRHIDTQRARVAELEADRNRMAAVSAADIHALMDKMAVLMEGVAEGWNDGLDNKGSAAFFAIEEAQQVYTRCAARYGTPEVPQSCESGEGEAEDDEPGPRSDLPECKMPPAMLQAMINNAVHLPISLLSPEEATTPTIRSIPVVVDASISEGGPQVIVSGCPFDEAIND